MLRCRPLELLVGSSGQAFRRWLRFASSSLAMEAAQAGTANAVLRHQQGQEKFTLSFVVKNDEMNLDRQFNLNRPINEKLSSFVDRLNANVEKALAKKRKKKKDESGGTSTDEGSTCASFTDAAGHPLGVADDVEVSQVIFTPDLRLHVLGQEFVVRHNPPMVERMSLPDQMMSGFLVYPKKLQLQFAERDHSRFTWFVSSAKYEDGPDLLSRANPDKAEWIQRAEGFFFTPTVDDIGRFLRVSVDPRDAQGQRGETYSVYSKSIITAGPGTCPFETRQAFTSSVADDRHVRVVSYNILADLYAETEASKTVLHSHCPLYVLNIDYRRQLLVKELLGYKGDIVCLQEVDSKLFVGDFEPTMKFAGLSGAMAKKSGQVSEGCAIFWRDVKFELVASHRFVLAERLLDGCPHLGSILTAVKANGELFKEMIERTTVLQAVVLKSKIVPQTYFVVGNTHLYFRPDADHIRLLHTAMAMVELEKLVEETKSLESEASVHLMLCGDFNSTPPFAVVELMTKGHIGEDHADWSSCPGQEVSGLSVKHPFSMASACGTPKYTNFTQGFKDCLDYIFYQTDGLRVAQVVPFPSEEELSTHVAIPSVVFPSDHIACVADLELMNQGK